MGIEVFLLQHHGVLVTVQQFHTCGLVGTSQSEAVGHACLTTCTALGFNLNHTVGTLGTPDGRSGSILQHCDTLDILRVHIQQLSKLFIVGR